MAEPTTDVVKLLFFGEMRKDKGLELLVEMFRKNRQLNLEFHIVGDGLFKDWFLKEYEKNPVARKLQYYGALSDEELAKVFVEMDAAIFPYKRKVTFGASGALLTVMAAGVCPIVVEDEEGLVQYVVDGETGIVFERVKLLDCLVGIENKKKELGEMGEHAQLWCKEHLTSSQLKYDVCRFFRSVGGENYNQKNIGIPCE